MRVHRSFLIGDNIGSVQLRAQTGNIKCFKTGNMRRFVHFCLNVAECGVYFLYRFAFVCARKVEGVWIDVE